MDARKSRCEIPGRTINTSEEVHPQRRKKIAKLKVKLQNTDRHQKEDKFVKRNKHETAEEG
jgi:hypothetical protein